MRYDFVIVGAGLYGAMFAYMARKQGKRCLVVEKNYHVGGFCHTERLDGIMVHKKGAHIFRTNRKDVWEFVNSICEFVPFVNSPIAMTKQGVLNLPFSMNTFSRLWGCSTPSEALAMIDKSRVAIEHPRNLEEFVLSKIGKELYELLVKDYTEKQWCKPCSELPVSIIADIPLRFTYDNNYFSEVYQGIPIEGYTHFISCLLTDTDIVFGHDYLDERERFNRIADKVVYTGRIDAFFDYEFGRLRYRSVEFEEKRFVSENVQGNAVVNYTSHAVPYTRSIEHRHFDRFCKSGISIVSYEYPSDNGEPCYPIEDERNLEMYRKYAEKAKSLENVIFGGRLAEYKYYAMNDIIEKFI